MHLCICACVHNEIQMTSIFIFIFFYIFIIIALNGLYFNVTSYKILLLKNFIFLTIMNKMLVHKKTVHPKITCTCIFFTHMFSNFFLLFKN